MGTPEFSVPFLRALAAEEGFSIVAVVTQPDRPRGRGHRVQPPPVKEAALELGLPVLQPERVRDPEFIRTMRTLAPDVIVLVAFGQLIPRELLSLPPRGCVNVHPSLLPRHRGAAPIQAAILCGDRETGVTTMYMDEGLDTGDIILQARVEIREGETAGELQDRLAAVGVDLLLETLRQVAEGRAPRIPQEEALATYAPRLHKSEGFLRWEAGAEELDRRVRAFTPQPGAYTRRGEQRLRIWRTSWAVSGAAGEAPGQEEASAGSGGQEPAPGTVVAIGSRGIAVQTGRGILYLQEVQPQNGRRMSGVDYANGYRLEVGSRFDSGPPADS